MYQSVVVINNVKMVTSVEVAKELVQKLKAGGVKK